MQDIQNNRYGGSEKIRIAVLAMALCVTAGQPAVAGLANVPMAPESQTTKDYGTDVKTINKVNYAAILSAKYNGERNFIVHGVDALGNESYLINEIGSWSESVFVKKSHRATVAISVQAEGSWSITIKPLSAASKKNPILFPAPDQQSSN